MGQLYCKVEPLLQSGQLPENRTVYKPKVNQGAVQKIFFFVLPHASVCLFGAVTTANIGLQRELYKCGLRVELRAHTA